MRILIAGDYVPQYRIQNLIENNDFSFFDQTRNLTREMDFAIVNLEAPIYDGKCKPIQKFGPNLKSTPKVIESLKYGGFNVVTLANNHIMDYGAKSLKETETLLNKAGILHVGTGKNLKEAGKTLYLEKNEKRLAIINCCENEFSIAEYNKPGANPLNPIKQFHAIQEAKERSDYILVIVHGGHEHWQLPSPRMVETYRFFIDAGADAVINHHQHCYSGYEVYKNKPIFYGLGNFCFDTSQPLDFLYEGFAVELNFKENLNFNILPYNQCKDNVKINFLETDTFNKRLIELNEIIQNPDKLRIETDKYYSSFNSFIDESLQPYNNRLLRKLYSLKLIPKLFRGRKFKILEDLILCESHRDKVSYYLKNK